MHDYNQEANKAGTQKKYWWVNYLIQPVGSWAISHEDKVMDTHPFYCKKNYTIQDDKGSRTYSLSSWQQITEEEYNIWNEVKNIK